ncbi:type I protein arginine N-methyltransferase Rmt1 [Histomonas meleagridis]|uniref:type I protein arginine N-methyltransferase Rmt1 n=1 Tax=Histomonas meleagridis TaxID=135588 RepID=UPI003559BACA|nr:type I protein arginine N-methyltransferase Rmt1 [Histomonas meleagridis]KAH0798062.1 type I protein arginine N-methyltransferase Rmt1 [Histomonas meleagridis]
MAELQSNEYYYNLRAHYTYYESIYKDYTVVNLFRDVLSYNPTQIRDKVILEVGSGLGAFSLMMARAGAAHVYAWEPSAISETSKEIIHVNNYDKIITVLTGPIENICIPEKVDVIFTSSIGISFYLDTLLPQFLYARDHFLKEGGVILPSSFEFSLAASKQTNFGVYDDFWDNVYGFDYTPIKNDAPIEPIMCSFLPKYINSSVSDFVKIDFKTFEKSQFQIKAPFTIKCNEDDEISLFVFWFKVDYQIPNRNIVLDTSPFSHPTHFCQICFNLHEILKVQANDVISGFFTIKPENEMMRPISYEISYSLNSGEPKTEYFVFQ